MGILLLDCKSIILLNCKYFTFIQNITVFIIINLVCILLLFLAKNRHIIYIAHFEDKHNDFLKIDVKRKTNFFLFYVLER